jgi:DNA-binding NarL/FixJ family response regulator
MAIARSRSALSRSYGANRNSANGAKPICTDYALTAREKQILRMLADGFTLKEIATKIHVSPATMIPHIKHIHQKLHVHTRGELIAKTVRENLV